jgi:hypothetical protein
MSGMKASIVSSKKDAAYAAKVNQQMGSICPELSSKYAQYPLEGYSSWLNFEDEIDGKPAFLAASQDGGLKEHYVWCKVGMKGKGYYHLLTKVSYVNLYNRVGNSPPGGCCGGSKEEMEAWETTKTYLYNRSRAPRPDDAAGAKASIDHMEGTKLNPVYGISG